MSGRWFRLYDELVDDPKVQMLSPTAFRAAFEAARRGEPSPFGKYLREARSRPLGPAWAALREATFQRDDYTCTYCGARGGRLECDHIVPVSRGGTDNPSNLTTACFDCNRSKRDKLVSEWMQ